MIDINISININININNYHARPYRNARAITYEASQSTGRSERPFNQLIISQQSFHKSFRHHSIATTHHSINLTIERYEMKPNQTKRNETKLNPCPLFTKQKGVYL
jgi:hypothetical protein